MIQGNEELKLFFHKLERLEADESRPVPVITEPSQLGDVGIVQQFEKMVKEIIETDDGEVALLGRRLIEDILLPQYPMLRTQNSVVYGRYQKLIVLLRFLNLSIHGMPNIEKLIKENLLTAMKSGINIKDKFQFILEVYHDVMMEGHIAQGLGEAVAACEEKLGNFVLLEEGGKVVPATVGNWLNEYLQMGLSGPEHRTGSMERIQFFKVNSNAQKLSESDRQWLIKIFRFYDWLRYGEAVEEEETKSESIGGLTYLQSQRHELPELEKIPSSPPPISPPKIPTPGGIAVPKKVNIEEIIRGQGLRAKDEGLSNRPEGKGQGGQIPNIPSYAKASEGKQYPISNAGAGSQVKDQNFGISRGLTSLSRPQAGHLPSPPIAEPMNRHATGQAGEKVNTQLGLAEGYVQKEIERKLKDLEARTKGRKQE